MSKFVEVLIVLRIVWILDGSASPLTLPECMNTKAADGGQTQAERVGDLDCFCLLWLLNPGNLKLNYTPPEYWHPSLRLYSDVSKDSIIISIARVLWNQSCSQTGAMSFPGKKNNPRVTVRNVSD